MKYLTALLIIGLYATSGAQSPFGALGTEWEHCIIPIYENPPSFEKLKVESVFSYEMTGMECSELEIAERPGTVYTLSRIHVCNDGDKVYYLEQDSLHLLYDFSLEQGDTYQVRYPILFDTTYLAVFPNEPIYTTVIIDSVSIENIDGVNLKKQHISTSGNPSLKFGKYAIERIGYEHWVLPFFSFDALELNIFDGMISYSDDEIYVQIESTNCVLTEVDLLDVEDGELLIFPNPASDEVTMESNNSCIESIEIISLHGKSMFKRNYPCDKNAKLSVANISKGSYIVLVQTKKHTFRKKLLIH